MTEPFYITAVMAALALAIVLAKRIQSPHYRKTAIAFGVILGTAVLLRQLVLLMVPFLFLWLALVAYKSQTLRRAIISMAIATAVIILFIIPFTIFNAGRFDRLVLLNTNAGYAFFWANHPIYGTQFQPASEMGTTYQELVPDELRQLDEAALEQELLARGIQFVIDEPVRYLRLSLSRIPAYFKFWPDSASGFLSNASRIGSFALFLPFMVYGLLRPFINSRRSAGEPFFTLRLLSAPILLLYLFLIVYSAIHVFTWAQIRYRLPVDAVLVIFAALAITDLLRKMVPLVQQRKIKEREAITTPGI
jgi:4-amino-4-deoxy-L-arabinose transferase-like glycosyltransferase